LQPGEVAVNAKTLSDLMQLFLTVMLAVSHVFEVPDLDGRFLPHEDYVAIAEACGYPGEAIVSPEEMAKFVIKNGNSNIL
jgi:hypothetical protein